MKDATAFEFVMVILAFTATMCLAVLKMDNFQFSIQFLWVPWIICFSIIGLKRLGSWLIKDE